MLGCRTGKIRHQICAKNNNEVPNFVDFVEEFVVPEQQEHEEQISTKTWSLYVDGSLNEKGSGAGILLKIPNKEWIENSFQFKFKVSYNKAEYETMITELGFHNSTLIVNQVNGTFTAANPIMAAYLNKVKQLIRSSKRSR